MRTVSFVALNLMLIAALASPGAALAAPGPTATLKQKNGEVDRLLKQTPAAGSDAEKKQKDDIKALASSLLDYQELARRSLDAEWQKLTPPQRDEFVATLRELIERNYIKQMRGNGDHQVLYKGERINGDEATVTTVIKIKTPGKSTDAEVVYKLHRVGERWLVWDIITDEVNSLVGGYHDQFSKIIREKSYDALLKKMKSKLAEGT
jgi:phospholipid transport system substrate-binding protein